MGVRFVVMALTVPGAVAAVAMPAYASIVGQAGGTTAPMASLTVHATVAWGGAGRTIVVLTAGGPPTGDAVLVDDSGEHTVAVHVLAGDPRCADATRLQTGLGADQWCLELSGIAPGQQYKGVLRGAATTLTLTASAHHALPLPCAAALLSLLAALALLSCTTRWLPGKMTHWELQRAERSDDGITGLRTWAQDAVGRLSEADILARLRWAKRHGKAEALGARAHLRDVLGRPTTHLPQCALREAAEAEAHRDDVRADELLTPAGTRATSTAESLLQLVGQVSGARTAFDQVADDLIAKLAGSDRLADAQAIKQQGDGLGDGFVSAFTIDVYLTGLRDLLSQMQLLVPQAAQPAPAHAVAALALGGGAPPRAAAVVAGQAGVTVAVAEAVATVGATIIVGAVLMTVAVATVLAAKYLTNPTFGTWTDYLGLVLTALGSSSAAGVLALVLLFRGPQAWYA